MLYVVAMTCNARLADVHARLSRAHNFYRVVGGVTGAGASSAGTWILCTNESAGWWYDQLSGFAKPGGSLLVTKLSEDDYRGYMPTVFWEWFQTHMGCG